MIEKLPAKFLTQDGKQHPTWNAARKHQTGLDLKETMRSAGLGLSDSQLTVLLETVLESWNVSRKGTP